MTAPRVPEGLPLDHIWLPVDSRADAGAELQALYQAQLEHPLVPLEKETDQV